MYILKIDSEKLKKFCTEILEKMGLPNKDASLVSATLVFADLRGVHSHGVARLKSYIDRIKAGVICPITNIKILREDCSTVLIDGQNGFGQVIGVKAMQIAVEKAAKTGICFVGVKNSNHLGVLAYYAMQATQKNMIGIITTNAAPAVAPWGGTEALFGTNPIAIGIPKKDEPLVLDMAFTTVARGKIRLAKKKKEKIPLGWALDKKGRPTTDPDEALKGSLVSIGEFKGVNILMMIDILCGILTGSKANSKVKRVTDLSGPTGIGNNFLAIDITRFLDINDFYTRVDELVYKVKNTQKLKGVEEIFLPGEPENRNYNLYKKEGIPLNKEIVKELENVAEELCVKAKLI